MSHDARRAPGATTAKTSHTTDTEGPHMGSNKKKRTTMAKLNRENALRERRLDKQARKDARKQAATRPEPGSPGTAEGA
jgi:hypothetical protein